MKAKLFLLAACMAICAIRVQAQEAKQEKPVQLKIYPSATFMYGLFSYKLQNGSKGNPDSKYYNANYLTGLQLNTELVFEKGFMIQAYAAYNRWPYADLFPVGLALKEKLNKSDDGLYIKLGGGYTFGKRYFDKNENLYAFHQAPLPGDMGNSNFHIQAGLEKYWQLKNGRSLSVGLMFFLQTIVSHYENYQLGTGPVTYSRYLIPYKFIGLTAAYHFY